MSKSRRRYKSYVLKRVEIDGVKYFKKVEETQTGTDALKNINDYASKYPGTVFVAANFWPPVVAKEIRHVILSNPDSEDPNGPISEEEEEAEVAADKKSKTEASAVEDTVNKEVKIVEEKTEKDNIKAEAFAGAEALDLAKEALALSKESEAKMAEAQAKLEAKEAEAQAKLDAKEAEAQAKKVEAQAKLDAKEAEADALLEDENKTNSYPDKKETEKKVEESETNDDFSILFSEEDDGDENDFASDGEASDLF